ncbi:MAG: hypothetical protein Q7V43_28270 [Myxococcales bacterium]|nr:hypothetical protein [Myxococcales bacterium]
MLLGALLAAPAACCVASVVGVIRSGGMFAPGSRGYRPGSPREEEAFAATRRDVHPRDVGAVEVAWAGVIRAFEVDDLADRVELRFVLEHRFFDWIEDYSVQRERYFVSPRGEGLFAARWPMPREARAEVRDHVHVGDLLLVYGPASRTGGRLAIDPARYVRLVVPGLWRDDVIDYGRDGEPARTLRTPMPFDHTQRAPLRALSSEEIARAALAPSPR